MLWLRVDLVTFKTTKGEFLLQMSAILRTVVSIKLKNGIEDVSSVEVQRKKRSVFRFKRDSGSGSGYVDCCFSIEFSSGHFVKC